jgi:hypothetical protein
MQDAIQMLHTPFINKLQQLSDDPTEALQTLTSEAQ